MLEGIYLHEGAMQLARSHACHCDTCWPGVQAGILDKYGCELIGAKLPSINRAEDRQLFRDAMTEIGLATPTSGTATNMDEAYKARTGLIHACKSCAVYAGPLHAPWGSPD